MAIPALPHPDRTDFHELIELANDRWLILCIEQPSQPGAQPRLFIDQFPDGKAVEDLAADGRMWLDFDDLEAVVTALTPHQLRATWAIDPAGGTATH